MTDAILAKLGSCAVENAYAVSSRKLALATRTTAGRAGGDVRSDLHVTFEERASGGIEIELQSRVDLYYGEAIRRQATDVLHALGVEHALVRSSTKARCRSSSPRASRRRFGAPGWQTRKRSLPDAVPLPPPSSRDRLRRSRLYLPGNEPKYFINAGLHAPDAVILDLEDSVHHAEKDAARLLVRNALRAVDFGTAERMVRINQLPLGLERPGRDRSPVTRPHSDPEGRNCRAGARGGLRDYARSQSHADITRPIWLMPILESALGIENAFAIAHASDRIAALTIGLEDYTADLGVAKTAAGAESLYARMRVVNAAHARTGAGDRFGLRRCRRHDGLLRWGEASRAMGFEGMGCVHPTQIEIIHRAFAPSSSEIGKGAEDCRCLRRCAGARARRGEPRLQDDRCARSAAGAASWWREPGRWGLHAVTTRSRRVSMSATSRRPILITNALGRRVPTTSTGASRRRIVVSTATAPADTKSGPPIRSNSDYPANGDKRVPDLETALRLCGLRDGMTISSHHHLRNGDRVALTALQTAARMGAKISSGSPARRSPVMSR